MSRVHFLKPLSILKERDMGCVPNAIIIFGKLPKAYGPGRVLSREESIKKGYGVEANIVQWRYSLFINLWLCTLDFRWEGKTRETK